MSATKFYSDIEVGSSAIVKTTSGGSTAPGYSFVGALSTGMYSKASLNLPGGASESATTPDTAALDVSGNLDVRIDCALTNWRASSNQMLICKNDSLTTNNGGFSFFITSGNTLTLMWGTGAATHSVAYNVPTSWAASSRRILRGTANLNDGSGNRIGTIYSSEDGGATWNTLGTTTTAGTSSIAGVVQALRIGTDIYGNNRVVGDVYKAWLYDGIAGTLVSSPIFEDQVPGATTFTDANTRVWTIAGVAALTAQNAVGFAGNSTNTASVSSSALNVTGTLNVNNSSVYTAGNSPNKQPVRAATTAAGTLASSFENGDTVDGVVLATGDRLLVKNQAAPAENGIYIVQASGAPVRAVDFDSTSDMAVGTFVSVLSGTTNATTLWMLTASPALLETNSVTFTQMGGGSHPDPHLLGNGTNTAPAYSFSSDTNTGVYRVASGQIGLTLSGTLGYTFSSVNVIAPDGSSSSPTYSFNNSINTGMYRSAADTIGFTTSSTLRLSVSTTAITSTIPHLNADGTAGAPAYAFSSETNTGIFRNASGFLSFTEAGTATFAFGNNNMTGPSGNAGAPTYSFSASGATGMFRSAADVIGWSIAGTEKATLSSTFLNVVDGITIGTDHDVQIMDWMTVCP